jgi:hypothetical protein
VAVTETSPTLPFSPAPDPAPRKSAVPPEDSAVGMTPPSVAVTPSSTPAPVLAPFGLTQHFDNDTHRLILEARDSISGYVIYQMPAKYVIKQLTASSSLVAPRGASVNRSL